MDRRQFLKLCSTGAVIAPVAMAKAKAAPAAGSTAAGSRSPSTEGESLDDLLEPIRKENRLPALAAGVILRGKLVAGGATGVRREGGREAVTLQDKFHIGSCTKPMTATLAALLVEQGTIGWAREVGIVFPELALKIHPAYAKVTLEQLLSHRAGLPAELTRERLWDRVWEHEGSPREQRLFLLQEVMKHKPESDPGTKFKYANASYAIAGAMLEKVAREPWEELITRQLFHPLGMFHTGFGAPGSDREVDQPWAHRGNFPTRRSLAPGKYADNPPAIAPGGAVHCPVGDLAKFLMLHLRGEKEDTPLLKRETVRKLHRPLTGQDYGLGWFVAHRDWAKGTALNHIGTNNMNLTNIWLAPRRDFGVLVMTNCAGKDAEKAIDAVVDKLVQKFLG